MSASSARWLRAWFQRVGAGGRGGRKGGRGAPCVCHCRPPSLPLAGYAALPSSNGLPASHCRPPLVELKLRRPPSHGLADSHCPPPPPACHRLVQRYVFYRTRFLNHQTSQQLAGKQRQRVQAHPLHRYFRCQFGGGRWGGGGGGGVTWVGAVPCADTAPHTHAREHTHMYTHVDRFYAHTHTHTFTHSTHIYTHSTHTHTHIHTPAAAAAAAVGAGAGAVAGRCYSTLTR